MSDETGRQPDGAEMRVRDIRETTRRRFSAAEEIRNVLEAPRGEDSIAELRRKESIARKLYHRWSKELLEVGRKRLAGDAACEAKSDEVEKLEADACRYRTRDERLARREPRSCDDYGKRACGRTRPSSIARRSPPAAVGPGSRPLDRA